MEEKDIICLLIKISERDVIGNEIYCVKYMKTNKTSTKIPNFDIHSQKKHVFVLRIFMSSY